MTAASDDLVQPVARYGVEILFAGPPDIDRAMLLDALTRRAPASALGADSGNIITFLHGSGEQIPQAILTVSEEPVDMHQIGHALEQSWSWQSDRSPISESTHSAMLTDFLAAGLPYKIRLQLFQSVLAAILDASRNVRALHWPLSQQLIPPATFLEDFERHGPLHLAGALNVRYFAVEESPGEVLMDTLGLAPLGLPDVQCHYRNLDADAVGHVVFNTALYLFHHGPVIGRDDTVEGIRHGERWTSRHEISIAEPSRWVIDLDPGEGHTGRN